MFQVCFIIAEAKIDKVPELTHKLKVEIKDDQNLWLKVSTDDQMYLPIGLRLSKPTIRKCAQNLSFMKKQIYQFFLVFLLLLTAQLSRAECPEVMVQSHAGFEQIVSNSEVEAKACEVVTALNITSTEIPLVLIYNWYPLHHFQDKEKGYEVLNERVMSEHADDPYCLMIIKEHHEGGKLVFRTHLKLPDFGPSITFDAIEQAAIGTLVHQAIVSNAEQNGNRIAKSYLADIAGMNELLALISRQKEIDNPFLLAGFKELEVDGALEWQIDNTTSLDGPFIYDYAGVKTVDGVYIRTLFQEALDSQPSSPAIIITSNLTGSFEVAQSNFNDLTQKLICWFHYEYIEESNSYKIYYNLRDNFTEEEALSYMDEEYENALEAYWATDTSVEDPTDTDTDTDLRRNRTSDLAKSGNGTGSYDCSTISCDALDIKWRAYCCILDWRPDHFNYGLAAGLIDGLLETVNFAQEASKIVMKGLTAAPLTLPWHADLLRRAWKERSFWRAFKNKIEDDVTFYNSMIDSMFNLINNGKAIAQGIANAVQGWLHDLQIQSGLAKTGYAVGKLAFEIILEYFTGGATAFRKVSKFTSHAFKQLASLTDVGKVSAKARGWFDNAYSGSLFRRTDRAKILKFQILAANCFLAGTPIQTDHQAINIEDIVLGQPVTTHKWVNNTQEIYTASQDFILPARHDLYTSDEQKALDKIELNQEPWYKLSLEIQKNNKEKSSIYLLRPESWVKEYQILGKGSEIWLSLPEQNIHGEALVIDMEDFLFPTTNITIDSASNFELQPVTGIFVNTSNDVWRLIFDNEDTLKVTSAHPLFSLDDRDWQMVSELAIGEKILTQQGHCKLLQRSKIAGQHTVYNLEVRKHHNFCAGTSGIIAHNAYKVADLKKLRKRVTDDPTFITDKDKDNIHLKTIVEMDEPSFKQFIDDVGEGGKIRIELVNAWKVLNGDGSDLYKAFSSNLDDVTKVHDFLGYNPSRIDELKFDFLSATDKLKFIKSFIGGPLLREELEALNRLRNIQGNNYPIALTTAQIDELTTLEARSKLKGYEYPTFITPSIDILDVELINYLPHDPQSGLEKHFKAKFKIENKRVVGMKPGQYEYVILNTGELRIGKGHAHLSDNASTLKAAGGITLYNDGRVIGLDRQSGHYRPDESDFNKIKEHLKSIGLLE